VAEPATMAVNPIHGRASRRTLVSYVLVRDREHLVEDLEALVELLARDVQRRRDREDVPMHERVQPALEAGLVDPGHRLERLAAGVERDERLARLLVAHQFQPPEKA